MVITKVNKLRIILHDQMQDITLQSLQNVSSIQIILQFVLTNRLLMHTTTSKYLIFDDRKAFQIHDKYVKSLINKNREPIYIIWFFCQPKDHLRFKYNFGTKICIHPPWQASTLFVMGQISPPNKPLVLETNMLFQLV
jgi:hypothetical protein